MDLFQLLFTYSDMIFIWIIIFIIQTKFSFSFFIAIINRFFFHLIIIIILGDNNICSESAKALALALKLNKTLTKIYLGRLLQLFQHIITDI